jgi:hypothetical protein
MSKKKMYGMLLFILFTFTILAIVIRSEFSQYSNNKTGQNVTEFVENQEETTDTVEVATQSLDTVEAVIQSQDTTEAATNETTTNETTTNETTTNETTTQPDNSLEELSEDAVMIFGGDVYLSDDIISIYNNIGIDGILSNDLQEEFEKADVAMVNEEFAFSTRGTPMEDKQFTFRVDPERVQILKNMKIDVVTLANNHSMDFGADALIDTLATLNSAEINYVGAGNNLDSARETKYIDVNNKIIAFLGASRVIPVPEWNAGSNTPGMFTTYDPTALINEIKEANVVSDFIVVYVHWGIEKDTSPEDYQRNLAKQYIDAGADLVIGSHPHVLQGIEYYNGKPIIYSLGNFMFYNTISQTALLKVTVNAEDKVQVQLLPCKAANGMTTRMEDASEISEFYRSMTELSFGIEFDANGNVIY